ncbi:MAG: adenylate cyclase [Actinomycetota bacterium]
MAEFLARAYARSARGYFVLFLAVLLTVILSYTGAAVWVFARYIEMETRVFFVMLFIGETGILVGLTIAAFISARTETALMDWVGHDDRGDREASERAVEAWNGLATLPVRVVIRAEICVAMVTGTPLLIAAVTEARLRAPAIGILAFGMVILELGCGSFGLILIDIFLRPVRTEIDAALPADFQPSHLGIGMGPRIAAELFILILAPTVLTAGALTQPGGGAGGLARTFAVGIVVTATFSGLIGLVIVERVSAPIRDLISGTRAVGAGDLAVRVPLANTDEHLILTDSFNRMVMGLRERLALQSAMGFYVDPGVAQRMMAEGARITGEAADVTVMFVDIVGFTAHAEGSAPEEIVSDLNEFFELIIPPIIDAGGHANKLLGDGLMAVFGVPLPYDDHADRALAAAREISTRLAGRYGGRLRAGVGLNSGKVVVGSMGGGPKLDYTIIGDAVNVAARVEAWTRVTGDVILLTDTTRAMLSHSNGLTSRGSHEIRGRTAHVELWTTAD